MSGSSKRKVNRVQRGKRQVVPRKVKPRGNVRQVRHVQRGEKKTGCILPWSTYFIIGFLFLCIHASLLHYFVQLPAPEKRRAVTVPLSYRSFRHLHTQPFKIVRFVSPRQCDDHARSSWKEEYLRGEGVNANQTKYFAFTCTEDGKVIARRSVNGIN